MAGVGQWRQRIVRHDRIGPALGEVAWMGGCDNAGNVGGILLDGGLLAPRYTVRKNTRPAFLLPPGPHPLSTPSPWRPFSRPAENPQPSRSDLILIEPPAPLNLVQH